MSDKSQHDGIGLEVGSEWVLAIDEAGGEVSVERQTVVVRRPGLPVETTHRYYYDHSHVMTKDDGALVVLATGERLRLA